MPAPVETAASVGLDLSDVAHRVGKPVGGAQLRAPCSALDIRRWVMAMDYPNPIHWDDDVARASRFAGLTAPQSFTAALDCGHGTQAGLVGRIAGSMIMFGGDEWWFGDHRIRPGDQHATERRFHDYRVTETKFAGPTMFSRGDTLHRNQDGIVVARQRTTVIRYLAAEAEKRRTAAAPAPRPTWTAEGLEAVDRLRDAWIASGREGRSPRFDAVKVGQTLPRRVLGPHSLISFTNEYRAVPSAIWGASRWVAPPGIEDPWVNQDAGWPEAFRYDHEGAKTDPRKIDGLYQGASKHHMTPTEGAGVGHARAFGFGVSMNAWLNDYVAYWAGHAGVIRHAKANFRGMALEGDASFLDAEITAKRTDTDLGVPLVTLQVKMTNQDGALLADAVVDVELPV